MSSALAPLLNSEGDAGLRGDTLTRDNPWPGLNRFYERDTDFFYAREAQTEELRRRVYRERLTVLYGVSGLGKSSLLLAGLFPRIRADNLLPVHVALAHDGEAIPLREQVLRRIASEAEGHGIEAPVTDPGASLWEHFHLRGNDYWTVDNRPVTPLLVFDQFEEAFTIGRSGGEFTPRTAAFLAELGDLVEGRYPAELESRFATRELDPASFDFNRHPYKVLLAVREDFLADLNAFAESHGRISIPSIMLNQMRLTPLSGAAALQVTQAGGPELVPPAVAEQIVRFVAGERDRDRKKDLTSLTVDPALLSLFCSELNILRKARSDGRKSITPDLLAGSQEEILAAYYQRCFEGLNPALMRFIERELITDTDPPFRDFAPLQVALTQAGVTQQGIDALIRQRLIRLEERGGTPRIELTHDVLTKVVKESRDRRVLEEERQAEERRLAEEKRRVKEETRRVAVDRATARRRTLIAGGLLAVAIAAMVVAGWGLSSARKAETLAAVDRRSADSLLRVASMATDTAEAQRAAADREAMRASAMSDTAQLRDEAARAAQLEAQAQRARASLEEARATVTGEAAREARAAGFRGEAAARSARDLYEARFAKLLATADTAARLRESAARANAKLDSLLAGLNGRFCDVRTADKKLVPVPLESLVRRLSTRDRPILLCQSGAP